MAQQNNRRRRSSNSVRQAVIVALSVITVAAMALICLLIVKVSDFRKEPADKELSGSNTVLSEPDPEPAPIVKTSTATIGTTGDLLMHLPIITGCKTGNGYNFDNIFTYFKNYTSTVDYAIANLETTLCGGDGGKEYSGYPRFNCPDEIVDAVKSAGFDMLLTANNHSYDTNLTGFMRTLRVLDEKQIDHIGTMLETTDKKYLIKDINGIKVGMICYTYETDDTERVALNGIGLAKEAYDLVNAFSYGQLDEFYGKIDGQIKAMKSEGAEAIVLFIHWGEEYRLTANKNQKAIAQKMCDLGVDVIVGGHSHVVEPIDMLESTSDPAHKTFCLYSMGNAVSNQRTERASIKTGHTEDGVLFSFTLAKYSDGTVVVEDMNLLPTWVNLFTSKATGKKVYQIIPLDESKKDNWKSEFDLTDTSLAAAKKSFDRTQKIVGDGLAKIKSYLADPEGYDRQHSVSSEQSKTSSDTTLGKTSEETDSSVDKAA